MSGGIQCNVVRQRRVVTSYCFSALGNYFTIHIESEGQETKQVPRMVTILEPTVSNTKLPWHKIDFNC